MDDDKEYIWKVTNIVPIPQSQGGTPNDTHEIVTFFQLTGEFFPDKEAYEEPKGKWKVGDFAAIKMHMGIAVTAILRKLTPIEVIQIRKRLGE